MVSKITVKVAFASRQELEDLDRAAGRFGGVRGGVEFRPCCQFLGREVKPHTATYVFDSEDLGKAFTRGGR